jgi:membrane protein DedA with SNARE-associated domain
MVSLGLALSQTFHMLLFAHPLLVIAALIAVEEFGVPSPVPSDLMMLLAGTLVARHAERLWVVLLVQTLATVAGASGLFLISRRLGRPFVLRYGRFIHLTPERLAKVEATVRRHGARAVIAGRLIPGLRIVTPIAVGALDMPYIAFLPALVCGGFLYLLAFTLAGMFIGPAALDAFERLMQPLTAHSTLLALAALLYIARRARPALRRERGLILGVVAGVAAQLATNGMVGILRFALRTSGGIGVLSSAGLGSGWRLLLGWPVFLLGASLLGAAYHAFALRRWPPLARVALLVVPPLVGMAFVVDPLLDGIGAGTARRAMVLLATEAVRWLAFGLALDFMVPGRPDAPGSDPGTGEERAEDATDGARRAPSLAT